MKEFRREHNTCYFDGVECSQIVLVTSKGFIRFSDSEFYFKKVKGQYESGQYSDTVMLDVKRGNKNTDISNLKDSRIIPSGSIPYEIRKDTYGDGNWLFLKTDDVVVSYGAEDEGHLYTSRQVQYQITFQGHVFIGVRHTSKTERHQACEEVYNNLEGCLSSYGDTARTRLNAKIDLLDAIVKGHISISNPDYEVMADNQQSRLKWQREGRGYKRCILRCLVEYNDYLTEFNK